MDTDLTEMQMEKDMKVSTVETKSMERANISTTQVQHTMETGLMIRNQVMECTPSQMVKNMKASIPMESEMEEESTRTNVETSMMVLGLTIKDMEMQTIRLQMVTRREVDLRMEISRSGIESFSLLVQDQLSLNFSTLYA